MQGNLKQDSDYAIVARLIRREVTNAIRQLSDTGTNPNFVRNFTFVGGNGSSPGTGTGGPGPSVPTQNGIKAEVYGVTGVSGVTNVVRGMLRAKAAAILLDDADNNVVVVIVERLNDPLEFIG